MVIITTKGIINKFKEAFLERLSYNLKNTWTYDNVSKKIDEVINEFMENIDLDSLQATTYVDNSQYSYRYDGNNVDIDTENSEMAKTQIKYQALMDSLTNEYSRIKTALSKS